MATLANELKLSVAAKACEGHPNAAEIMAVLSGEEDYNKDIRKGAQVPVDVLPEPLGDIELPEAMAFRVSTLSHWKYGFCAVGWKLFNAKHRESRDWHGLGFCLRAGGKGRYAKPLSPSVRRKVRVAYAAQVAEEKPRS